MFYLKLAIQNIRKSLNNFLPFILASLVLYILVCSNFLIMLSPMSDTMKHGTMTLSLAAIVLTIFSVIMAVYSFNFLMKQRSREFGLYHILGMKKSQISLIASLELIIIYISLIILGSLLSIVFANFLHLVFINLIHVELTSFKITVLPFIFTNLIFLGIFLILELFNLWFIKKTSPLALFTSREKGEKEPKGNIVLALLSIVFLSIGYYLSLSSSKIAAIAVLQRFFIAVILVIIGTYLFYISFTTWYLKKKRNQKNYFYKPEHFITVSQMIFRMKQNAIGLANITLLAIMAFVTIATTFSLYSATQKLTDESFPKNTSLTFFGETKDEARSLFEELVVKKLDREIEGPKFFSSLMGFNVSTGKNLTINEEAIKNPDTSSLAFIYLVTQDDFRSLDNDLPQLKNDETAFFVQKGNSQFETITFFDYHFKNIKNFKTVNFPPTVNTYNSGILVVSNDEIFNDISSRYQEVSNNGINSPSNYTVYTDLSEQEIKIVKDINDGDYVYDLKNNLTMVLSTKKDSLEEAYITTGGFLFTGFLLGFSFLLGAALIIYYKQYTEGNEDKKSYQILQEVGMSQKAVKKTINSQTIFVFFMPLAMAIMHFVVALVMLKQMLTLFGITDDKLVYLVSAVTISIIVIIYFIIYKLTSRTYYKIIKR
ncbi:FtsX-like permease family protein [Streptococcus zalophi]|uniref:FtsX-like permease family protein n=1 Tax=Streptococcus zalophi TaxID=640031 RepID=A0A934P9U3_9STRE|nr:ABC transporter permease [Streptococcus zalophi]MBJ8349460.1 FtsX-like permease family protein [Streptococcus zalophi]